MLALMNFRQHFIGDPNVSLRAGQPGVNRVIARLAGVEAFTFQAGFLVFEGAGSFHFHLHSQEQWHGIGRHAFPGKSEQLGEIQRREGILPMLEHDRVDYYIDALTEVDYVLGQASQPERFRRTHVAELPLYLAFARNDQAKALCDLFDKRMKELVRSGELKPIFEHWKQPYPFNAGSHPH